MKNLRWGDYETNRKKKITIPKCFTTTTETAKPLLLLTEQDCRWPIANNLFCGANCEEVYCNSHMQIAFDRKKGA